jgi:uncharacterized protein YcnI
MKIWRSILAGTVLALAPGSAWAHVTVQPNEYEVGSFARFVVRVPTEGDSPTTKVSVQFPESLVFVSFQPKDGWKRTVKMKTLDEPIEVFGEEVSEVVGSVTWSGGSIAAGEFDEFGFSAKVPDEATDLEFKAIQTYKGGEVVRWIGPEDSDQPAAHVNILDTGATDAGGQLAVIAQLRDEIQALQGGGSGESDDAEEDDDEDSDALLYVALGLGGVSLLVALAALTRKRT